MTSSAETLTINLRPWSVACPNCRSASEVALVDGTLVIAIPPNNGTYGPQLGWCDRCKVFFCTGYEAKE
jgi:hypothetical protein